MLDELPIVCPWQDARSYSSFHLYVVRLRLDSVAWSHGKSFDSLRKQEISVNLHYIPVYRQPYFREMGFRQREYCPEAERYYAEAISLPLFPTLTAGGPRGRG